MEEATTARLDSAGPHSDHPQAVGESEAPSAADSDLPESDPPPAASAHVKEAAPAGPPATGTAAPPPDAPARPHFDPAPALRGGASIPEKRSPSDRPPPPPPRAASSPGTSPLPPPPPPRPSAPEQIGRTLDGRYRIEERLGMGGVGAVYLGTQLALGRSVAIKLLHEGLDPSFRTRFEREAKALAALRHPNIVSVTDYGVDDTTPYLVMEKLEGETLGERLTRGPLLPEHVLELTRQLLRALGFVHEQGLVHRDLKPGNLFLELTPDGDERLKLLDFGLAKFVQEPGIEGQTVTRAGHVVGTPAYMAPEQIAGDAVDARSDIYAVGILLFQALSGKVPFQGEPMEQLKGHLVGTVPPLTVQAGLKPRAELAALVTRALEKRRDARFESALDMLTALEAVPQPWLIDEADPVDDEEGAKKTVVNKAAQKRHITAQQKDSRRPGGGRLVLALLLGALALYAIHWLRKSPNAWRELAGHGATAVPPAPAAEAEGAAGVVASDDGKPGDGERGDGKPGDMDMVIALPEAARDPEQGEGAEREGAPADAVAAAGSEAAGAQEQAAAGTSAGSAGSEAPVIPDNEAAVAAAEVAKRPPQALQGVGGRNPWTRDTPAALRFIRKAVMEGSHGNDRMIATLRKYNRQAADKDARGHLLLARMYLNRGWREDALNQFTIAFHVDPSSRGAPKMLGDVLTLVAYGKTSRDASRFVREAYGPEAVREIDRALIAYKQDPAAVARLKALRAAVDGV